MNPGFVWMLADMDQLIAGCKQNDADAVATTRAFLCCVADKFSPHGLALVLTAIVGLSQFIMEKIESPEE